jgi:TonB family protein
MHPRTGTKNSSSIATSANMARTLPYVLYLLTLVAFPHAADALRSDFPVFDTFAVPPYPYLARLAATEGTIHARVKLDDNCNVTDIVLGTGPPSLVDAVTPALYGGRLPLRFRPCTSDRARDVQLSYIFSLEGQATNEWSPTYVSVSGNGSSFAIKITTTPPDLDALGLGKKSLNEGESKTETGTPTENDVPVEFTLPRYPPLARSGNVQGEVRVVAKLDSSCKVSGAHVVLGHALLNSEVLDAVRRWRFASCATTGGDQIILTFHFALSERDESVRDDWSPTQFEMIAPYEFQIKTAAAALIIYN